MVESTSTRKDRIYLDETVSDIYRQLRSSAKTQPEAAPFETFKDIFMFAACLGFRNGRRVRTDKTGSEIRVSVFTEDDIAILKAIAISETGDVDILTRFSDILTIVEEYANVGIYEVKGYLIDEGGQPLWNLVDLINQNTEDKNNKEG